jgi:CDP-2,3-bis-(O-geranylgeranyl)-sn-glycerol synthase
MAFVMAGFAQTFWLRSPMSRRFQKPLDGGKKINGKRILGDNKTYRGLVIMIPAVGLSFVIVRLLFMLTPLESAAGLWRLSVLQYGLLGTWAGFGFMVGELPNSFIKRQIGIPPGSAPRHAVARMICFVVDRLDSIAGGLLALAAVVVTPLWTWLCLLFIGPAFHLSFSLLLFRLGVKARPA